MNFFCFSFALNQKYRAANLLRLIVAKSVPKYALSKTGSKITIATQNNEKTMQLWRKRPFNTISFDNIEKLQKRMKNKFSNIAYQIRGSVGDDFKIIISTKSNAVESSHSDESDIRSIYITFLEKHLSAKVYWPCTKRSKLQCLPLCCYFGETLLCCQYVHG